uniref:Putative NADH-dependent reductase n=1 Tax=Burkholderia cepacia TaxID=292 RepID=Q8VUC6_BURCE|nr:putative NADH-dependent reductase [Burkholderia cepacia]
MTRTVIGLSGSLREKSFNGAALQLAGKLLSPHLKMMSLDWRQVPVFDADVLAQGEPPMVAELKRLIHDAAGVVIATPEYNFSIPGGLKNLIDWLSRGTDQPFVNKPVALLSAATGPLGGARVQYDLRKVLLFVNAAVLAKPEVFIGAAATKFDEQGNCTDAPTRQFVADQMQAFERWIERVERMGPV